MVDPDDVAAYVGGLCEGVSDADQASLRSFVQDEGYRVVRLRDVQGVQSSTFLERLETTGCCGSDDGSTCSCIHVASDPQHIVSPSTSNAVALLGRVVTTSSTRAKDSWQGLYLSDGDTAIPIVVLRPDIACLHQLVLVTSWKCIQARTFVYLEVESVARHVTSARAIVPVSMTWESLLTACYPTRDGPVYGGPYPVQRALAKRSGSKPWSTKSRHFVVAGRVACISPVCAQVDVQYYFIEVEVADDSPGVARHREFISVLMAGHTTAFHPFLWPGQDIVLTDLVKVFAKECNMYMLHTTTSPSFSPAGDWYPPHHDAHTTLHHVAVATRSPLPPLSIHRALLQHCPDAPPPAVHFTGQLTRRLCDDSFELNHAVVVIFAHFPLPNRCAGLRVGATISIYHSHRLGPALLGLCSRSSVVLDSFARGRSPILLQPRSSRVQELAFHQVPLTTVAYLLELSQDVLRRFSSRSMSCSPSTGDSSGTMAPPEWDVFQDGNMRKQTLLRLVATSAGVTWRPRPTLGHSFLCHSSTTCFSASLDAKPTLGPAMALQTLVDRMVNRSNGCADDAPEDNRTHQFVYPSSDEPQPSILLLGCIQGSMATNDLHLVDRTATVPLVVVRPGDVALAPPSTLYHLITYDVVVTRVPLPDNDSHSFGPRTAHARAIHSATHVTHVHIRCHALRPIVAKPTPHPSIDDEQASTRRRLLVLRIDGLPRPSLATGPTHFLVHGVLLPLSPASNPPTASESDWCVVQVLVPRAALPWHVHAQSVWDVRLGKASPQRVEFTPPLASMYAFDYHLAKFKHHVARMAPTAAHWSDVHTEPKVADALVQYRVTADTAAIAFEWVSTLFSTTQDDDLDDLSNLWHAMASQYDAVHAPSSLLVIPLPTQPSTSTDAVQPHPSVFDDRVVSTFGTVTDLVVVPLHEYRHHGNATAESHDCVLQVTIQDVNTPDTVSVGLWMDRDQRRYKWPSGLALGVRVVFHRVKLRVRKRGFKLDMVQVHATAVTLRCDAQMRYTRGATAGFGQQKLLIVPRGLHNAVETSHVDEVPARMIDMYQYSIVDRRVHRFVATVTHISYAILKCICRHCRGPLTRESTPVGHDRRTLLRHDVYNLCSQAPSPMVVFRLRCIVDDASAQVELHCDGDVAWDLLQMPERAVYEALTVEKGGEVAYFSSNDVTVGTREALWRTAVVEAMSTLGQVSIHARRFYGKSNSDSTSSGQGPPMSVLRCGDFSVRTPVQPMVHMEATSVDVVHAKAELRRLLR